MPIPLQDLVDASDRHASGVRRSLKGGVLAASADVLAALVGPNPAKPATPEHLDDAFEQALTIVYRIVFLLFAEARALVPVWHPVYRDSYSLDALRAAIERPHGAIGLWDALRAIARLAHAGCRAGDLRVTPFNGRLFAPARTPLAERRNLDDDAARRAMLALSTRPARGRGGPRANRLPRSWRRATRRRVRNASRLQASASTPTRSAARGARPRVLSFGRGRVSERPPERSTRRNPSPNIVVRRTLGASRARCRPRSHPSAPGGRSVDGQRRVSRGCVPLSGGGVRSGARPDRRLPRPRHRRARTGGDPQNAWPSAACTAWT